MTSSFLIVTACSLERQASGYLDSFRLQDKLDDRRLSKHLLQRTQTELELAAEQARKAVIEHLLEQVVAVDLRHDAYPGFDE